MQLVNKRQRGFFTFAQNNDKTDYVRLAYGLALSLRATQKETPWLSIGVPTGTKIDLRYAWAFDNIIEIPWGDDAENSQWKLENEWKAIWMSPYDETIKLDSDMLFFNDIASWWDSLSNSEEDIIWTNRVLNWRGSEITSDYCRKVITKNNLPNIYSALFYFKKTDKSFTFFKLASLIFWNWQTFFDKFLIAEDRPTYPSTDIIYALAAKILDEDQRSYTSQIIPTFTHMKSQLQGWNFSSLSDDWRQHVSVFFEPTGACSLGHHRQFYPLHYHLKYFLTDDILSLYEQLVRNG
jgi:hypothetical protein